jgi:hypothetical protein
MNKDTIIEFLLLLVAWLVALTIALRPGNISEFDTFVFISILFWSFNLFFLYKASTS